MASINVHCPRCDSALVYRHGKNPAGHERFRCRECHCVFQLTYTYQARKPGVKDQVIDMAFNGTGVRATARTLKIGINTVIRTFKKLAPKRITSSPVARADVALICELDEQWSFVGNKARQHWLWYAYNTKTGGVLAYTFGPRTDETCRELLALLTPFHIGMITSDDWGSYSREVPKDKHLTGKIFTQRIERNNLTLRTRIKRLARKTICFSRSIELHEKVIGAFIEKYMFY
ncbi:IS1 family transposase [Salmonella enterica]|uniref:IS1 family transposase n=1 Tax=Salmonella enterica subsp. salamae serovar 55:k:z39 str. 1315K TaxID=1243602 RepID=A0A6C7C8P0_SALER|nr:IS1 family transposase [Salmonella enterica]ECC1483479.1 IS1 family transposase [Salmonella enterica subsp. salamae]EHM1753511.1 IS1 family transposase [Salmonella enterica subsp. salamae serovar 40:c:e,n,x,z15]HCM2001348.1 IS1 family transposase [Salmonella enterica subsp. salamae serovar [1],40:z35:e,n,x,z15]ASG89420.1 IS1 family transposase [Salmonella enterica subsp. salamae serovar 55:k:z39 str. 1315K]ECC1658227.1 IS1 family transposase [Salmonella enterica subsp. salamae]